MDEIKIYECAGVDWFAARNVDEAKIAFTEYYGDDADRTDSDWIEVTDARMDLLTYTDDWCDEDSETRTFREHLAKLQDEDTAFPMFFATSEH